MLRSGCPSRDRSRPMAPKRALVARRCGIPVTAAPSLRIFSPLKECSSGEEIPAIAAPSQHQALRVVDKPVGDRGGPRGRVKPLSPLGQRHVGGKPGGFPLVPLAENLAEAGRALLATGKITHRITDQSVRGGVMRALFQQRAVGRRRNAMREHVHGRGTEPLAGGIAGRRGEAFRQAGVARPGMANAHALPGGGDAVEVAERQKTGVLLLSGFMMVAGTLGHGQLFCEGRLPPAAGDSVVPAGLQCDVGEEIEGRDYRQGVLHGLRQGGGEGLAQAVAAEVGALVFEPLGVGQARVLLMTQASYSARADAASRSWWRCAGCSRTGGCCRWGGLAWDRICSREWAPTAGWRVARYLAASRAGAPESSVSTRRCLPGVFRGAWVVARGARDRWAVFPQASKAAPSWESQGRRWGGCAAARCWGSARRCWRCQQRRGVATAWSVKAPGRGWWAALPVTELPMRHGGTG
jgi:hypothetical protein